MGNVASAMDSCCAASSSGGGRASDEGTSLDATWISLWRARRWQEDGPQHVEPGLRPALLQLALASLLQPRLAADAGSADLPSDVVGVVSAALGRVLRSSSCGFAGAKPNWVPDEAVACCMGCSTGFGAFTRRHHCRLCGSVVCASCLPHKVMLSRWQSPEGLVTDQPKVHEVCQRCFEKPRVRRLPPIRA
jgi:hypothetical protein